MDTGDGVVAVEFFAAKDSLGGSGVMMTVPVRCGLKAADTLRVDGLTIVAMKDRSILPVDLPMLSEGSRAALVRVAERGKRLPVGEFMARGLFDSYFLTLVIV